MRFKINPEYIDKQLDRMYSKGYRYVLVWYDDHGDWFYDATTKQDLLESSLVALQDRINSEYIGMHEGDEDHMKRAQEALEKEDGLAAYMLLEERSDYEYERISLEALR